MSISEKNRLQSVNSTIGITSEIINKIISDVDKNNEKNINDLIINIHPADTADLLETLTSDYRRKVIYFLSDNFPAETLPSMNVPVLIDIIDFFELNHLAKMISNLDTDDITYILDICEESLRKEILKKLSKESQKLIKKSLNYNEDSAGRIMQTDYVSVPVNWNIGQVVDYLRMSKRIPEQFYALFAVDSRHIPVGTVPLHRAMRNKRNTKILDIMTTNPRIVKVNDLRIGANINR